MSLSMFCHKSEGKDRFFTIRGKKYLVVEMPAGENLVDIYVGILRKDGDYRFNKEHNLSNLKVVGSNKEREKLSKIIGQNFYSEHRKDDVMINEFEFIGCKKPSKKSNPGTSYSTPSNIISDWNEEQI